MAIWSRKAGKRGAADEPPTRVLGEPTSPEPGPRLPDPTPPAAPSAPLAPTMPVAAPSSYDHIDVSDEPETEDMDEAVGQLAKPKEFSEPKTQILKPDDISDQVASEADDPPAGFLIIVDGPGKGNYASYGYGVNTIGRGANQRVQLDFGDANISRENHAQIVFDPQSRKLLLRHEQGANLTYFKGQAVLTPTEIAARETFKIADTTLLVLPLCDDDWDWETTEEE